MIGPGEIFTIFFVTLGPLKLLGPFAQRTHGLDDAVVRQIAWRAFLVATVAIVAGALLGRTLAANVGLFRTVRTRPLHWARGADTACVGLGAVFFALPLLWPERFFHLTWGSFAMLLEPWNRRHARESFLQEARQQLTDDEQFSLLANYENGEYRAELEKLRGIAAGGGS